MRNSNKISIERSAFKKSGYILLHLLTDIRIKDNIVKYNQEADILIPENDNPLKSYDGKVNDNVIMCLRAGPLSEKYYCWLKCINYDPGMSGDDLWQISRLFYEEKHESPNFEKYLRVLEEKTDELLKIHWPFVMIIAKKFINKKDLTIEEITDLWEKFLIKA